MVYGGHLKTLILDMEDNTKSCNNVELVPQSIKSYTSWTSGFLNGMPVVCEAPQNTDNCWNDGLCPANCHIYKNHTWQFLASLPTIRAHSAAVNMDDNHLWITGGTYTPGKDTLQIYCL